LANGYFCEDCEVSIWPAAPRSELAWLQDRIHVVRDVAKHSHGGLHIWMAAWLAFLEEHRDHTVLVVPKT